MGCCILTQTKQPQLRTIEQLKIKTPQNRNENQVYIQQKEVKGEKLRKVRQDEIKDGFYKNIGAVTFQMGPGRIGKGTAVIVSPNLILTVAHNIYDRQEGIQHKKFKFYPAPYGIVQRYYEIQHGSWRYPKEFQTNDSDRHKYEYALLKLKKKYEGALTTIKLAMSCKKCDISRLQNMKLSIYGYPFHDSLPNYTPHDQEQRLIELYQYGLTRQGYVTSLEPQGSITYRISTLPGQSGAPIICNNQIVGIHFGGGKAVQFYNLGRLITSEVIENLITWSQELGAQYPSAITKDICEHIPEELVGRLKEIQENIKPLNNQSYFSVLDPAPSFPMDNNPPLLSEQQIKITKNDNKFQKIDEILDQIIATKAQDKQEERISQNKQIIGKKAQQKEAEKVEEKVCEEANQNIYQRIEENLKVIGNIGQIKNDIPEYKIPLHNREEQQKLMAEQINQESLYQNENQANYKQHLIFGKVRLQKKPQIQQKWGQLQAHYMYLSRRFSSKEKLIQWTNTIKQINDTNDIEAKELLVLPLNLQQLLADGSDRQMYIQCKYDFYQFPLSKEIQNRRQYNYYRKFFLQEEMWYILYTFVKTGSFFEQFDKKVCNFHPTNVLINESGWIKLLCICSQPQYYFLENGQKEKDSTYCAFLAPQYVIKKSLKEVVDYDDGLSQVFCLSLTVLSAGTLQQWQQFQSDSSLDDLKDRINQSLITFKKRYSQVLFDIVARMLAIGPRQRPRCSKVLSSLQKYKVEIMDLKFKGVQQLLA